jgi:hypothetical protein
MKLLFLSEANLRDRLFVQNFVFNLKLDEKAIIILDSFGGTVKDTRFVTRRISSLLSEAMVYNNAFTADQRGFFFRENDVLKGNWPLIDELMVPIQAMVFGPVLKGPEGPQLADPLDILAAVRGHYEISETFVFVTNPMSPLGAKRAMVESEADIVPLLAVYEEEKASIDLALKLSPARLVGAQNMAP